MRALSPFGAAALLAAAPALLPAAAGEPASAPPAPAAGDPAPGFEARDDAGAAWSSADHIGKKVVVLYFYPADFTGGCTKQACGYRDDHSQISALGAEVVGVSGDAPESHRLFRRAHGIPFTLLADEDGAIARKFGVPLKDGGVVKREVEGKALELRRGVTAARWTFVIGRDGKIAHRATGVDAAADSGNVLKVVAGLAGGPTADGGPPTDPPAPSPIRPPPSPIRRRIRSASNGSSGPDGRPPDAAVLRPTAWGSTARAMSMPPSITASAWTYSVRTGATCAPSARSPPAPATAPRTRRETST